MYVSGSWAHQQALQPLCRVCLPVLAASPNVSLGSEGWERLVWERAKRSRFKLQLGSVSCPWCLQELCCRYAYAWDWSWSRPPDLTCQAVWTLRCQQLPSADFLCPIPLGSVGLLTQCTCLPYCHLQLLALLPFQEQHSWCFLPVHLLWSLNICIMVWDLVLGATAGTQDSPAIPQESGNQKTAKMWGKRLKTFPFPTEALKAFACQNPLQC